MPGDCGASRRPQRPETAAGRRDSGRRRRRRRRGRGAAAAGRAGRSLQQRRASVRAAPRGVAWGPATAPEVPAEHPLGKLAIRRITDATNSADPLAAIKGRLQGYTAGDTDLAWSRITYWRALLASAIDQPPCEPVSSALVSGLKGEPSLDVLAGWLASRIPGPVTRAVGALKVELVRPSETVSLSRPQTGVTATLSRTARPDALLPLARREAKECLAEDLRRLDADEIYYEALQ